MNASINTNRYILWLVMLMVIFIPCALMVHPWFHYMDGCEHAAAVKELARSLGNPQNPHLDLPGDTSTRFVPSIIIMAIVQKIFSVELFNLLGASSIVIFIVLGVGIYLFTKEYFKDAYQPLYALLCILFLWGKGWDGANAYMFSVLVSNAYYPSVVAFIGIFFGLYTLLRYLNQGGIMHFIVFIVLGCLIFLNHPLTGFLFFFIAFILMVTEHYTEKKNLVLFIIASGIAIGLTALWPYYSFFKSVLFLSSGKAHQFWDYRFTHNYLYSDLATRIGPGFLGIIPLVYFAAKKQYPFLVFGFFCCVVLYALGYFLNISLGERFIFLCMLFLQLGFARFLKLLADKRNPLQEVIMVRGLRVIFISALVIGAGIQLFIVGQTYLPQFFAWEPRLHVKPYENPMQRYITLREYLPEGSVVLSDIGTSWILPCVTDAKVVALFHNSLLFPQNIERMDDTEHFFTSPGERKHIIQKYHISHVLVDKTKVPTPTSVEYRIFIPNPDEALCNSLATVGDILLNNRDFFLVRVDRSFYGVPRQNVSHSFMALSLSLQASEISGERVQLIHIAKEGRLGRLVMGCEINRDA